MFITTWRMPIGKDDIYMTPTFTFPKTGKTMETGKKKDKWIPGVGNGVDKYVECRRLLKHWKYSVSGSDGYTSLSTCPNL